MFFVNQESTFRSRKNAASSLGLAPFINFLVFLRRKQYLCYEIRNFKEAATGGVL